MIKQIRFFIAAFFMVWTTTIQAQSLTEFLQTIEKNNKTLKAAQDYSTARQWEARTDITPDDPEFELGYFPGNTNEIGTKQVIGVTQNLEFPTAYVHKSKLAQSMGEMAGLDYALTRQQLLTDAAGKWCQAVYLNQKLTVLREREAQASQLVQFYEKKQANGDATQLEVNKARLFAIDMQNRLRSAESQRTQLNEQLLQLNGGVAYAILDTIYGVHLPENWEQIKTALDSMHPELRQLEIEDQMAATQLKLNRAQWLPNLMVGYESETTLSETFQGVKAGISIPLWQDKNKMKRAKAEVVFAQAKKESRSLELVTDYHNRFVESEALLSNTRDLKESLGSMNNQYLLSRSLELGQISAIEYFMELVYFYDIIDQLNTLELQYQLSWVRLNQFRF